MAKSWKLSLVVILMFSFQLNIAWAYKGEFKANLLSNNQLLSLKEHLILQTEKSFWDFNFSSNLKLAHDTISKNQVEKDFIVQELYLSYCPTDVFDVYLGRKISIWGKADEFNPTDFMTAQDLRYFIYDDKGKRAIGTDLLEFNYSFDENASFALAYIPFHKESILPSNTSIWRSREQKDLGLFTVDEDTNYKKNQFASKFSFTSDYGDFDFIYYYGHHLLPEYKKIFDGQSLSYKKENNQYNGYGISWTLPYSSFTFRFEGSYIDQNSLIMDGVTGNINRPSISSNIGIDWSGPEGLYINIQYVRNQILDYIGSIVKDRLVDYIFVQVKDSLIWDELIYRLRYGVEIESRSGWILNPQIQYTAFERYQLSMGSFVYGGSFERGLFSQYDKFDMYYLTAAIIF